MSIKEGKAFELKLKSFIVNPLSSAVDEYGTLQDLTFALSNHDHEAFSSGTKMAKRARTKYNTCCRATRLYVHFE